MPAIKNSDYFAQRVHDCVLSARNAADGSIAKVHRNFAKRYREAAAEARRAESVDDLAEANRDMPAAPVEGGTHHGR